jgi:hypothetical protein
VAEELKIMAMAQMAINANQKLLGQTTTVVALNLW